MKLNKRGFTLVELLAVIAILVTILLIAIPSITSSLARSEEKQLNAKKELIASEVEIRINKNDSYYTNFRQNKCTLSISKLKELGFITDDMSKDSNGNAIEGCVAYKNNSYVFLDNGCLSDCA